MIASAEMTVPFLDLAAQYPDVRAAIHAEIDKVIDARSFVLGPSVERFEERFAAYCEADYAMGVSSGTAALHLALLACGVGPGDEVITTTHSFIATCWPIAWVGATPVLVDVDPETLTIDPARVAEAITPRTKAIIPVHLYGQPADMDPILAMARSRGIMVIEDACQAHGARYKGRRVGALGDIGCFSFYPGKNLGAFGEAGAVVTNNREMAHDVHMRRNHGQARRYIHEVSGFNYRMEGIQGAVLGVKLHHLDDWNSRRMEHARAYDLVLAGCRTLRLTSTRPDRESVHHLYVVRTERRDALREFLLDRGIETGLHYPLPIHLQPAFAYLGYKAGDFPVAEAACASLISLPMYAELAPAQVAYVAEAIQHFLQ